jgi:cation-transporting ATPase I
MDHPGDSEPLSRTVAAATADVLAIGGAMLGHLRGVRPISPEPAALLSLLDAVPEARRVIEQRLGLGTTDLGLSILSATFAGLGQSPLGPMVDLAYRGLRAGEWQARRRTWEEREADLCGASGSARTDVVVPERVVPLPRGPIERYADAAATASLVAAGLLLPGGTRRAASALLIGAPRAARLGREGFATTLGRTLATRGVLILDDAVLRRLDRIDTVVLESEVLLSPDYAVADLRALRQATSDEDLINLRRHVDRLLIPDAPTDVRREAGWTLGPAERLSVDLSAEGRAGRALRRGSRRSHRLVLLHGRSPVAVILVEPVLDPFAEAVVAAASTVGTVLLAGRADRLEAQVRADGTVPGGSRLATSVRELQEQGRVVALAAARNGAALAAADCGIGIVTAGRAAPWGAHLLCGPGLIPLWSVLKGAASARPVSRRSATIAGCGTAAGAVMALTGSPSTAAGRALVPVHAAALLAMASGVWSGSAARGQLPTPSDTAPWHEMAPEVVLEQLRTSLQGLSRQEAERRRGRERASGEAQQAPVHLARALVDELNTPLTAPLATGAGLSAAVGSLADALMVSVVLAGNALVGAAQRTTVDRALRRLSEVSALRIRLRRDGEEVIASGEQLAVGDILELAAGDMVPADCRVLSSAGLEIDESSLTGESMLVKKGSGPTLAGFLGDRTSMLYEGTVVAAGTGSAVVVATGDRTEAGRVSRTAVAEAPASGVQQRLRSLTSRSIPLSLGAARSWEPARCAASRSATRRGLPSALPWQPFPRACPLSPRLLSSLPHGGCLPGTSLSARRRRWRHWGA